MPDLAQRRGRARPDRRDAAPASERASPPRRSSSSARRVRRGDADEVVVGAVDRLAGDRLDADRRALDHPGAQLAQPRARGSLACARARVTATVRPCSGRALGPGDAVAQRRHRPDHGHRGRPRSPPRAPPRRSSRACAATVSLGRQRAEADDGGGRVRVLARRDQRVRDRLEPRRRPSGRRACRRSAPARPSRSRTVSLPGSSWPVTTANCAATPRCVTGMPAYAGAAIADVMPGTTSNGDAGGGAAPAASSPPRPNTNGSPPFSRTTSRPGAAVLDQAGVDLVLGHACGWSGPCRRRSAGSPAGASSSSSAPTSRSYTSTSARRSSSSPRTVISPGSPGPAPTR